MINEHPSLQFMQKHRKFEGKIPKLSQQQQRFPPVKSTSLRNVSPFTSSSALEQSKLCRSSTLPLYAEAQIQAEGSFSAGNRVISLISGTSRAPTVTDINSSQRDKKPTTRVIYSGMLPAVNSVLNGVFNQHHQHQQPSFISTTGLVLNRDSNHNRSPSIAAETAAVSGNAIVLNNNSQKAKNSGLFQFKSEIPCDQTTSNTNYHSPHHFQEQSNNNKYNSSNNNNSSTNQEALFTPSSGVVSSCLTGNGSNGKYSIKCNHLANDIANCVIKTSQNIIGNLYAFYTSKLNNS